MGTHQFLASYRGKISIMHVCILLQMVSVAGSDLSAAEAGCSSTTPFSDTAVGLCTYWDALEIVEETKQELDNLFR